MARGAKAKITAEPVGLVVTRELCVPRVSRPPGLGQSYKVATHTWRTMLYRRDLRIYVWSAEPKKYWRSRVSIPVPRRCERRALPIELDPLTSVCQAKYIYLFGAPTAGIEPATT